MKNFRKYVEENASKKDQLRDTSTTQLLYPSGFMYLDYVNGSTVICYDDEERPYKMYDNIGIMNGSLNILIGKSQVGKSTLASKIAVGILETWINIHYYTISILRKQCLRTISRRCLVTGIRN